MRSTALYAGHLPLHAGASVDVSLIPNIKKKKGKKKEAAVLPALDRIMGYAGSDMSEEEVRGAGGRAG
jgi:hypothetical protein